MTATAPDRSVHHNINRYPPIKLSTDDWRLLDLLQDGLPVIDKPYHYISQKLNLSANRLLNKIDDWLGTGVLTRFGPLFNAERIGGDVRLCAIAVPEERFDHVTTIVNRHTEVAHNYQRRHKLNMWFVLASEQPERIDQVCTEIEAESGYTVLNFPKIKEFFIGLKVMPPEETGLPHKPLPDFPVQSRRIPLSLVSEDKNRTLVKLLQSGLPLVERPYAEIAHQLSMPTIDIMDRLTYMLECRAIRRIGAVPNHYALGWTYNAMTVWDVSDEAIDRLGAAIGSQPFVSHCYQRPRHFPDWPYCLFAMVHGYTQAEIDKKIRTLTDICGSDLQGSDCLVSTRILKKTGLRLSR